MDMIVHTPGEYAAALRKLFPPGDYWERQFSDPESDCSLFCKAKLQELVLFRRRMSDLQAESAIQSASETIEDWERVITGSTKSGFDIVRRRAFLISQRAGNITVAAIKDLGHMLGITITGVSHPFCPAFFGFSRFGMNRIASPAAFCVCFIYAIQPDESKREQFEAQITARLPANHIVYFQYDGGI